MFDFSGFKMQSALGKYFSKIDVTPDYIKYCLYETEPRYENDIRFNGLFFPRESKLDFSFFKELYGYEMPNILKSYYSICHVDISGHHCKTPDRSELILLGSTVTDKLFEWFTYDFDEIDKDKYIPIGITQYYWHYICMERDTGHILIEDYDENDDSIRFFTFLSDSLPRFISELKPPDADYFSYCLGKLYRNNG